MISSTQVVGETLTDGMVDITVQSLTLPRHTLQLRLSAAACDAGRLQADARGVGWPLINW